ncbi:hypothetical protein IT570_02230 [Candidatus Sumerlaeota bacterium]|nr:hypothetical protein [Candidatus Sumerlaeota bacterium]
MKGTARIITTMTVLLVAQRIACAADGQVFALAGNEARVEFPRIASKKFVTAVGWVEMQPSGLQWVRLVSFKDGVIPPGKYFPEVRVVSSFEPGTNSDVALAIGPKTQPAIAWIHSNPGISTLQFSDNGGTLETITQSTNLLDPPVICFDDTGIAYAAWSEVSGGSSQLFVANRTVDGWQKRPISAGTRPYDVIPQLFTGSSGIEVYWYAIQSGDVAALSASVTGGQLGATESLSLGQIPANRLPLLYSVNPGSRLGAYWVEQRPEGEVYLNIDPRDHNMNVPSVVGGETNRTHQLSFSNDGTGTSTWIDSLEFGEQYLTIANRERGEFTRLISDEAREPAVTTTDNWIHAVWIDTHSPEGTGALWYWRVH